eukprot:3855010-Rhodomonas_salina.1
MPRSNAAHFRRSASQCSPGLPNSKRFKFASQANFCAINPKVGTHVLFPAGPFQVPRSRHGSTMTITSISITTTSSTSTRVPGTQVSVSRSRPPSSRILLPISCTISATSLPASRYQLEAPTPSPLLLYAVSSYRLGATPFPQPIIWVAAGVQQV